jgi:Uma2 family endonuclease
MSSIFINLPSKDGEPTWEAAYLLPEQGRWTEEDFFKFHTNRMAELVNGRLEILPMPNLKHQKLVMWLLDSIRVAVPDGGLVLFAPLPVRLFAGRIREPDLLYISPEHLPAAHAQYPTRIDLAIEIVSEGSDAHKRDYEDKRDDYAQAGVAEYWIVDPQEQHVIVMTLRNSSYQELGTFKPGQTAKSQLLPTWSVNVEHLLSLKYPLG